MALWINSVVRIISIDGDPLGVDGLISCEQCKSERAYFMKLGTPYQHIKCDPSPSTDKQQQ